MPPINISLPIIFVVWCVVVCVTPALGPVMLAYPAIWALVGAAFFALDRALRAKGTPAGEETVGG